MNYISVIGHSWVDFEESGIHQVFSGLRFAVLQLLKPTGHVPFILIGRIASLKDVFARLPQIRYP